MKMNGSREIAACPAAIYEAILDPKVLEASIPGAQSIEGNPEDGYEATVTQKIGPVKATFKGKVTMSDLVENRSIKIAGEGKGGAAGFAKGEASVNLEPKDGGTLLTYDVEARLGGKIAQLGSRLVDGVAKKLADAFFDNLRNAIEGPDAGSSAGSGSEGGNAPAGMAGTGGDAPGGESGETPRKGVRKGWLARLFGRG